MPRKLNPQQDAQSLDVVSSTRTSMGKSMQSVQNTAGEQQDRPHQTEIKHQKKKSFLLPHIAGTFAGNLWEPSPDE